VWVCLGGKVLRGKVSDWKENIREARRLTIVVRASIARAKDGKERSRLLELLERIEAIMLEVATGVEAIVNAANQALANAPVVPVGGAIIDAAGVAAINAQAALVNQPPISASQIQQAPVTPAPTT